MTDSSNRQRDIKLYGYPMAGLTLDPERLNASEATKGALRPISHPDAGLARIHALSVEGQFQHLPQPIVVLVKGEGASAAGALAEDGDGDGGLTCWDCDADDLTLRFDIQCGPLDALLQASIDDEPAELRLAGAMVTGRKVTPKYKSPKVTGRKVQPKASGTKVAGAMTQPKASGTKVTGRKVTPKYKSPRVKPGYAGTRIA